MRLGNIQGQALVSSSPDECKDRKRDKAQRAAGSGARVIHPTLLPLHQVRDPFVHSQKLSAVGRGVLRRF